MVLENVETDASVGIDIWMVDLGCEVDLGRLEGLREGRIEEERKMRPSS